MTDVTEAMVTAGMIKAHDLNIVRITRPDVRRIYEAMRALDPSLAESGDVERLQNALERAGGAIASLPEDALGFSEPRHEEDVIWPLRDELLHMIDAALRPVSNGDGDEA